MGIEQDNLESGTALGLRGQIPVALNPALKYSGFIEHLKSSKIRDANCFFIHS